MGELIPRLGATLSCADLLAMDGAGLRRRFAGTPLLRARRRGLLRNAAVVLGNLGDAAAVAPLIGSLETDADPVVRGHAAWALRRLGGRAATVAIEGAARRDPDEAVRRECVGADGWPDVSPA